MRELPRQLSEDELPPSCSPAAPDSQRSSPRREGPARRRGRGGPRGAPRDRPDRRAEHAPAHRREVGPSSAAGFHPSSRGARHRLSRGRSFGIPFVVFVAGRSRGELVPVLRERLERTRERGAANRASEELVAIAKDHMDPYVTECPRSTCASGGCTSSPGSCGSGRLSTSSALDHQPAPGRVRAPPSSPPTRPVADPRRRLLPGGEAPAASRPEIPQPAPLVQVGGLLDVGSWASRSSSSSTYARADTAMIDPEVADISKATPAIPLSASCCSLRLPGWCTTSSAGCSPRAATLPARRRDRRARDGDVVYPRVSELFAAARGVPPGRRDARDDHGRERLLRDHPGAPGARPREQAGPDPAPPPGRARKQRSVHNNYLTLPVIFTMLAGHFP